MKWTICPCQAVWQGRRASRVAKMCEVRGDRRSRAPPPCVCVAWPDRAHCAPSHADPRTTMEHTTLGRSDLRVSRICLGTMTFGEQVDEADAHAILDRALERGVELHRHRRDVRGAAARARPSAPPKPSSATGSRRGPACAQQRGAGHQGGRPVARHALGARRQRRPDAGRHRRRLRRQPAPPADRRDRPLPDPLARTATCRRSATLYFDPTKDREHHVDPRAARGAGEAGEGRQGARTSACPTKRPGACTSSCALAEQHGLPRVATRAEPVLPGQPRGRQRAGRGACTALACRCWRIRRSASAC